MYNDWLGLIFNLRIVWYLQPGPWGEWAGRVFKGVPIAHKSSKFTFLEVPKP